ncbi:hypothetical protein HY009_04270 [Candidatus Acetothermia bacterium]|nr:hypothetical protein [Candidatus Acetothermia bacterium]
MTITLAPLDTVEDLQRCEELQKAIWGFEDVAIVPQHLMLTAVKSGGLALGAFESEGAKPVTSGARKTLQESQIAALSAKHKMIGFLFGFPGVEGGKLKHCSLMCGVLPDKRFQGVGYDLKCAQREFVIRQGLELVTWTFDPLQSSNAHFNLRKLGVVAQRYERNVYGNMRDRLNQGLDTDRFMVEWWVNSVRVRARVEQKKLLTSDQILAGTQTVNPTVREKGLLVNRNYSLTLKAPRLLVEVPHRIAQIKEKDAELAKRWRHETREIFETYLHQGYWVTELATQELAGEKRSFYLLEQVALEEILERT